MKYIKRCKRAGKNRDGEEETEKANLQLSTSFSKADIHKRFRNNLILQSNQVWGREERCVRLTNAENKYTFLVN